MTEPDIPVPEVLRDALVDLVINHGLRSVTVFDGRYIFELREPSVMELALGPVKPPLYGLVLEAREVDI